ncbi:MAG: AtpZ/AtpI family protein [Desulfitobacterium sp.]|nr:AtpZ/AtpI family protein [Desulfitobacterium sp.]
MKDRPISIIKAMAFGTSLATTLGGLVVGGFFLGKFLDGRFGTYPLLTLIFIIAGLVLGGIYLVFTLRKFDIFDEKK